VESTLSQNHAGILMATVTPPIMMIGAPRISSAASGVNPLHPGEHHLFFCGLADGYL